MSARAAIVTGGSRGIGLAVATMLAEEGHALTLTARDGDALERVAESPGLRDADVQLVPADLRDEDEVRKVVDAHRDRYGRLDVLVNNAGVLVEERGEDMTTEGVDVQLETNLRAPILFYRECDGLLREAGSEHGRALVVNTASFAGKRGYEALSVYCATKFGIVGLSDSMNRELARHGVRSCAICPAYVDSAMTDRVRHIVPAEEMIKPRDIAEAVRLLLRVSGACIVPEIALVRREDFAT